MLRLDCDRCNRDIVDDSDADGIRTKIAKASKSADAEYLYIMSGDEDGEPTGKHYCLACTVALLGGARPVIRSEPAAVKDEPEDEVEDDAAEEETGGDSDDDGDGEDNNEEE